MTMSEKLTKYIKKKKKMTGLTVLRRSIPFYCTLQEKEWMACYNFTAVFTLSVTNTELKSCNTDLNNNIASSIALFKILTVDL